MLMYSDIVSIFKVLNKDLLLYYILFRCDVRLCVWFFFFFYSNISFFLISPSNFFLLMIWNVRCLNGQHDSLMLIFGVENPSSLQVELGSNWKRRGRRVDWWWWRRLESPVAEAIWMGSGERCRSSMRERESEGFCVFFIFKNNERKFLIGQWF